MTVVDSLHMVLLEFGDVAVYEQSEEDLGGTMTLHEVIGFEFSTVRAPLGEVTAWLVENVRIRRGFHELVDRFRPLVVSSGFHELIEPILAAGGVDPEGIELVTNHVTFTPQGGEITWRELPVCELCGEECKRGDVARLRDEVAPGEQVVYIGDGLSDRCGAETADRIFARAALADYLTSLDTKFEQFDDFVTISAALWGCTGQ